MKLNKLIFVFFVMVSAITFSQENSENPKGAVTGKIYFNYHVNTNSNEDQVGAFELTRVYFGYKYKFDDKFSAKVLLDAGKNSAGSQYTLFVKNAQLDYKANDWITLTAGIFGLQQFKVQEDFWQYRYLYKSLDDEYKFGASADLGVMGAFKVSEKFRFDVTIVNGEGYTNLQDQTGNNRYALNVVYNPIKSLTLKGYVDVMKGIDSKIPDTKTTMTNLAFFAGYKMENVFRIGAEYNLMQNAITYNTLAKGYDETGLSFYGAYDINKKWDVFARFDIVHSNTLNSEQTSWNNLEDGNTIIAGVEYKVRKGINTSLNYRNHDYTEIDKKNLSFFYLNLEFAF
ncbi:hypothetical protein EC396_00235 [Lutibacter sp. HS1-25]|uniref:outer membrane beta-barrel protein n=1 Tax=Lutibacter sp. HS1-25 TaxID=2485000 RepID=UPI001013893D|nr:outer membrane beta-barrel protein [Lutibacter sp. HS1-25]RXP64441.1 hypothetical protein EC396_00235 [Lutibacter sp. HS1-25]